MSVNVSLANLETEVHRWTRQQFEQLVELGVFSDTRVELIDGYILNMAPQSSLHALAIRKTEEALRRFLRGHYEVRSQMPIALDDHSEPEPDIAVVTGRMEDYRNSHPSSALLLIEVAYASLDKDQTIKQALYARNNIPEYWIINLDADCIEIYRQPQLQSAAYQFKQRLYRGDVVKFLIEDSEYSIAVADILP